MTGVQTCALPISPDAPGAPAPVVPGAPIPGVPEPIPAGVPAGQNPTPFVGQPPFNPPTFNPVNGSMVGVAKPIYINFARPIANKQMAQDAVHISSTPAVPGMFYWVTDTQLRWRPIAFWPANTVVNIDAAGTKSTFRTGDYLVATIDDKAHQMEVMRNGKLEKTFPVSMGRPDGKHETKNGTYYVLEKFPDIVMDSSTYGVPVNSPNGYKLKVQWAVRPGADVSVITYGGLVTTALNAAQVAAEHHGWDLEVIDLRSLRPMDYSTVIDSVSRTTRLICVYEGTRQLGIGTEVAAAIAESKAFDRLDAPIVRLGGADCPLPYNPDLERAAVPQVPDIVAAIRQTVKGGR